MKKGIFIYFVLGIAFFSCTQMDLSDAKTHCPCVNGWTCAQDVCVRGDAGKEDIQTCTPKTCQELGVECGSVDNGCGGTVDCGGCGSGKTCQDHKCLRLVWKDPATNYEWQVNPSDNNGNYFTWQDAMDYCKNLSLDGGNWHLPSISELRSLIRGCPATITGGSCKVTDNCLDWDSCQDSSCYGCDDNKGPGPNGVYGPSELNWPYPWYWSSSSVAGDSNVAWIVDFGSGYVYGHGWGRHVDARCVRLGP